MIQGSMVLDTRWDNMLIEAQYKVEDTITIKLSTGEELVAKLKEENENVIKVKTPLTLVMGPKGLGLQQFLFTADPDKIFTFKQSNIIMVTKTVKQFADVYQTQTSGIVTAPPNLQVK